MPRHFAIGDIHGCFRALSTLAEFVGFREDDLVITLGDYVNRGSNTHGVIDWLIRRHEQGTLVPLLGNHEIMMRNARLSPDSFRTWLDVGGDVTLNSYAPFDGDAGSVADIPEEHWTFLDHALLPYYETETHFFVHAGAYPDMPLAEQPEFILHWEQYDDPPLHESGKVMVCGHTSQKSGLPVTNGNAICIDTWACGGGWLSCLEMESGRLWQANENGETRQLFLDELPDGRPV